MTEGLTFVGGIGICRENWYLSGGENWHLSGELVFVGRIAFVGRIGICRKDWHLSGGLEFFGRISICRKYWHLSGELAFVGSIDICREDWHLSGGLAFVLHIEDFGFNLNLIKIRSRTCSPLLILRREQVKDSILIRMVSIDVYFRTIVTTRPYNIYNLVSRWRINRTTFHMSIT